MKYGKLSTGDVLFQYAPEVFLNTSSSTLGPKFENFFLNAQRYQICNKLEVYIF
jgi:hypothetical protein